VAKFKTKNYILQSFITGYRTIELIENQSFVTGSYQHKDKCDYVKERWNNSKYELGKGKAPNVQILLKENP